MFEKLRRAPERSPREVLGEYGERFGMRYDEDLLPGIFDNPDISEGTKAEVMEGLRLRL